MNIEETKKRANEWLANHGRSLYPCGGGLFDMITDLLAARAAAFREAITGCESLLELGTPRHTNDTSWLYNSGIQDCVASIRAKAEEMGKG